MSTTSDLTSQADTPELLSIDLDSFNLEPFELPNDFLNQLPPNLFQLSSSSLTHDIIPMATPTKRKPEFEESSDLSSESNQTEPISEEPAPDPDKISITFTLPMETLKYLKRQEYLVVRQIIFLSGSTCQLKLKTNHQDIEFLEFISSGTNHQVSKSIELLTLKIWKWKLKSKSQTQNQKK
ncbi:uncharacterized protein MELLADRAFT_107333 [Melampsora larici-populina 98AG31]|uniref:Uncharacterized protein n=1 Tax=Melampsora larici-populina (strain 98AG31 / pathotype 3-4-7) TaxID=747676 RepID=F4RPF3_MELLP|nr:uncharacterized protein MELLADRAFT_107333 [Melampsora larici-populina 98AG31]EGG05516.1 hypothetical protein MELLADRAFT_107333 [Melampsora larici-populina 98AG31]